MKLSTTLGFGALVSLAAGDALPSHIQMYALNKTSRAQIGCVNGFGNFTNNIQDCGIFYVTNNASGFGAIEDYAPCSADGVLDCFTSSKPARTDFFSISSELYLPGTGFDFSIAAVGDGPLNLYGTFGWGVPLYIGDTGAILLEISVKSVTG